MRTPVPTGILLPSFLQKVRPRSSSWHAAGTSAAYTIVGRPANDSGPSPSVSGPERTPIPAHYLTIVTGASRGLGAALARILALNGPPLPASTHTSATKGSGRSGSPAAVTPFQSCPTSAPASSGAVEGPTTAASTPPWTHDLVLLASDPTRLNNFVARELSRPFLGGSSTTTTVGTTATTTLTAASPTATTPCPSVATGTRIRTMCFDLGDLDGLEANTIRLLSPSGRRPLSYDGEESMRPCASPGTPGTPPSAPTAGANTAAACKPDLNGAARVGNTAGSSTAASAYTAAGLSGAAAGVVADCSSTNDGVGGGGGVLPLPPGDYTHVLLVHNAGQVGDLLPLEQQGLANMRRQTDLNVTSFTHLTAAVLRTFLPAPLLLLHEETNNTNMVMASLADSSQRQQQQQPLRRCGQVLRHGTSEQQQQHQQQQQQQQQQMHLQDVGDSRRLAAAVAASPAPAMAAADDLSSGTAGCSSTTPADCPEESPKQQQHQHRPGQAAEQESREDGGTPVPPASSQSPPLPVTSAASPPAEEAGPSQRRVVTIVNISSVSVDQPYEHFSLYGMGKAARHMIVRSIAHEAALREAEVVEAATAAAAAAGTGAGLTGRADVQQLPARVRALSYAPGAIDTEMQAAAREALPPGPLKARFEDNAASGQLVDPRVSAQVLYDILRHDSYGNGAHCDYYSAVTAAALVAGGGPEGGAAAHPLARVS